MTRRKIRVWFQKNYVQASLMIMKTKLSIGMRYRNCPSLFFNADKYDDQNKHGKQRVDFTYMSQSHYKPSLLQNEDKTQSYGSQELEGKNRRTDCGKILLIGFAQVFIFHITQDHLSWVVIGHSGLDLPISVTNQEKSLTIFGYWQSDGGNPSIKVTLPRMTTGL